LTSNFFHVGEIKDAAAANEFCNWLFAKEDDDYPLEIFLNGMTIRFNTSLAACYFILGWQTHLQIAKEH
jgi:hypothetical protein